MRCLATSLLAGCSASRPSSALWEETGGPYVQEIRAVVPDSKAPGTLYASLGNGRIALSATDGRSWEPAAPIPGGPEVIRLLADPETPGRVLASTEDGAFLSPDTARSWTPLHVGPPGTPVRVLTIDPWTTAVVYAGTGGRGLYKSSDAGTTWSEINGSPGLSLSTAEVYDIAVDLSKPDNVFAAVSPYGIIRSTDGGASWNGLTPDFSQTVSRASHILMGKPGRSALLFGTTTGNIMKSTNGGSSWIPSRLGREPDGILSLSVLPGTHDGVIAGTARGVIISSDFGSSWHEAGYGLPALPTCVAVEGEGPHATLFAYGSGMGIRASDDIGASWRSADIKLGGSTVGILATDAAGERLFAATGNVCMAFSAGGWSAAGPGITGGAIRSISIDPHVPGLLYATTPSGLFLSRDNGGLWGAAPRPMLISPILYEAHPSIATRMLMASDQGIFVSTDRGRTWNQTRPTVSRWMVHSLTFSPSNAGTIIGATSAGGVILSSDGGFTWEQARYGIPGDRVEAVALDDVDPDTYYAYLPDGDCFRSLNRGLEWNRYAPPWKQTERFRIACDPHVPSSVVALIDDRFVYYSPSGGGTWFRVYDAALRARAVSLCWNAATMTLYAGAQDRGVFKLPLGGRLRALLGE